MNTPEYQLVTGAVLVLGGLGAAAYQLRQLWKDKLKAMETRLREEVLASAYIHQKITEASDARFAHAIRYYFTARRISYCFVCLEAHKPLRKWGKGAMVCEDHFQQLTAQSTAKAMVNPGEEGEASVQAQHQVPVLSGNEAGMNQK